MSIDLPADFCLLESQVAGHTIEGITLKYGMLRNNLGTYVYKPLSKPSCAKREIEFYKELNVKQSVSEIQAFFPRYEGHLEMLIDGKKQLFIKMENLTHGMERPCVMDIKVGRRTYDPLASAGKIAVEEQKYAACKNTIGLCIPGFQIYNSNRDCIKYGKEFGKHLNHQSFFNTLAMFLGAGAQNTCYKPLIKAIINQLYKLQKWFTSQSALNFFSSSILIAYDYEVLVARMKNKDQEFSDSIGITNLRHRINKDNVADEASCSWVKVKIIDCAHVFESETGKCDGNYLFGLQNLIYMLQEILIINW